MIGRNNWLDNENYRKIKKEKYASVSLFYFEWTDKQRQRHAHTQP